MSHFNKIHIGKLCRNTLIYVRLNFTERNTNIYVPDICHFDNDKEPTSMICHSCKIRTEWKGVEKG